MRPFLEHSGFIVTATLEREFLDYQALRRQHWDQVAQSGVLDRSWGGQYHRRLMESFGLLVPPGLSVLEIGCGRGELLASLRPLIGVGVDFSEDMLAQARVRHPSLEFVAADAHTFELGERTFDVIVLSDLINDLWDVQTVLERLRRYCHPGTRLICNFFSHLWAGPLRLARSLGMATPNQPQNWLTVQDMANLLDISGFELLRDWEDVLLPLPLPLLAPLANRYLVKLSPFKHLALAHLLVARPRAEARPQLPTVSVIVPARNESGHIEELMERIPDMGGGTEIIWVEGNSTDDTYQAIEKSIAAHPERRCRLLKQPGKGKGDAVRTGFAAATGDILMILDADITVPPEDLPRFYAVLASGLGDFVNGVRLVYPMQQEAMRFLNLLGNKFFSHAFSWLLGQPIRDTLCGTKVLWRADYLRISENRAYFGDFDPFGDFDLLFGAAKLSHKIVEIPIRYRARRYGETNIQRWAHGWLLLKMVVFAARRVKFV